MISIFSDSRGLKSVSLKNKIVAIIPARGGSQGIKQKNIRDVGGRPLIYYQIRNALQTKGIDKVIVSTDSVEIAGMACGTEISWRPEHLAGGDIKSEEVMLDILEHEDIAVLLEPTNPLNRPENIEQCIEMVENGYDSAGCFVEDYNFFVEDTAELLKRPMKQNKEAKIRETGCCWATRVSVLKQTRNRLGGNFGIVMVDKEDALHMDDETDWMIIDRLIRDRQYYETRKGGIDYGHDYWHNIDPDGVQRDKTREAEKYRNQHRNIIDYINALKGGRILDVGCGTGLLLACIEGEWEKHGTETHEYPADLASQHGQIKVGNLEGYAPDSFDVVVLNHVIEHMTDPISEIREIRRILKPYGKLIIETPDFDCEVARRFGENFRLLHDKGHISLFNILGLHRLLIDNMFEVEKLEMPYFQTEYFTQDNLLRLYDVSKTSPPFCGNVITMFCYKK